MSDLVRVDAAARQAYDELRQHVWQVTFMPSRKPIITTMLGLRRALGDSSPFRYVKAIAGVGYRFEACMRAPSNTSRVEIDGAAFDVLHWDKRGLHEDGRTHMVVGYLREVPVDGS
ncbi:helix-turn-helix domain-containing protein [Nonomuraea sp. NPDC000554]|uniref:helix-turn-helix domain-containing protein n=1 Tax=Nonomuraea sp. NPDC000554 TaxID=3154259 RepID=UPI003329A598